MALRPLRGLNEVQLLRELQLARDMTWENPLSLNEVQLLRELQRVVESTVDCDGLGLNEVQLLRELQHPPRRDHHRDRPASMKCSSRRNCNTRTSLLILQATRPQ